MNGPRLRSGRTHWWRAGPPERGSVSIQQVILLPLVFMVVFAGLQGALYYHASTIAGAAAQDGARAAAAYDNLGSLEAGRAAAVSALAQSHGSLQNYGVAVSNTGDGATVTVTGEALSIVPGIAPGVTRSATLPWEKLT